LTCKQGILKKTPKLRGGEVVLATSKKIISHRLSKMRREKPSLHVQEEIVLRLRQGIAVADDEILEKKTNDPELLARLLELERAIIKKARGEGD
jgi:hypothetical protein